MASLAPAGLLKILFGLQTCCNLLMVLLGALKNGRLVVRGEMTLYTESLEFFSALALLF